MDLVTPTTQTNGCEKSRTLSIAFHVLIWDSSVIMNANTIRKEEKEKEVILAGEQGEECEESEGQPRAIQLVIVAIRDLART